jgi:hypothetical protein
MIEPLLRSLMPSEVSYVQRVVNRTALWIPQSKPQWMALLTRADELFYGGAAGGGKTDLGLGLALECHQKSTFFRREFTHLTDVVDRGDQIMAPRGITFNHQRKRWEWGGNFLALGAIDHADDLSKYQGRARDLYVFDEVSFFPEAWVRYITAWRRSTDPRQRTRVLMLGNPPTAPEGEWVINYFAPWLDENHPNPAQPGELRWFVTYEDKQLEVPGPEPVMLDGKPSQPRSRTFIPAYLDDNPFLRDTEYRAVLQGLPEALRQKLLDGKFNVKSVDDPWQVIPTEAVKAAQRRYREGQRPDLVLRAVGNDPARGGSDEMATARLYHEWFEVETVAGSKVPDGPEAAKIIVQSLLNDAPAPIFVDVIGVGSSVYDSLKQIEGVEAYPINVAEGTKARDKTGRFGFANVRAEMYWKFREALEDKDHAIAIPDDPQILRDLCIAKFSITKNGIQVEPKESIKLRLGRSPDKGESILLAWHGATRGGVRSGSW